MSGRVHDRHWVSAPALVAVVAVLVLPATPIHLMARSEPARSVAGAAPVLDMAARPVVAPTETSAAVRRAVASWKAYQVATTSPRTRRAIRWAVAQQYFPTRTCLYFVRTALQVPRRYPTAMSAWVHAKYRHRSAIRSIPAGVPVFTKGASSAGHIVLSLGNGWVRSTDWPHDGRVGTVQLTTLLHKWHHRYLGWSEDLNGVRIWNLGSSRWVGSWAAPHRR